MDNLKLKYEQIRLKRKIIKEEINKLETNRIIKRYFYLRAENDELTYEEEKIYKELKIQEYSTCNHIWIKTLCDPDIDEEDLKDSYCGCIKCGLNEKAFYMIKWYDYRPDDLELDDRIMYDFFRNHYVNHEIYDNLFCNLDLAKAIYLKIKEAHPGINDETAIKYLHAALHFIRDIRVSDERKVSRAKRLSLTPDYFNIIRM